MSAISRTDTGVFVNTSDISEVHVHVSTTDAHILPFMNEVRLYFDISSGDTLDDLIESLIEARTAVVAEANRRWTEDVKVDADSELVGNPMEEEAA